MTMWSDDYKHLADVWGNPTTDGIFSKLQDKSDIPWKNANIPQVLDLTYYYNHSGNKIVSPLIDNMLGDSDTLTEEQKQTLADLVYGICNENWKRVWDALFSTYNPIWNTDADITETETRDLTGTNKGTNNTVHGGTDTHTSSTKDDISTSGADSLGKSGTNGEGHNGADTLTKTGDDISTDGGTDTFGVMGDDTHALGGSDAVKDTGTDTVSHGGNDELGYGGTDSNTDTTKVETSTEGDEKIYHHSFTTDHNDDTHGNKNITTTTTQIAGYDSNDFANSNVQKVETDSAVVHRTTNGEKNDSGALTDEEKSWHNADITDDDRTITESHTGGTSTTYGKTETTTYNSNESTQYGKNETTEYGKTDTEHYSHTDTTTYGKSNTLSHNTIDKTEYGENITYTISETDTTTYGKNENRTIDTTNTDSYNSNEDVTSDVTTTDKGTVEHKTIRQGNIGVTTTQQMITEEIQLRKEMFYERVFSDIDRYLTIGIY